MLRRWLTVGCLLWILGAAPLLAQRAAGMPVTFRSLAQLALNPGVLSELGIEKDAPVVANLTKLSEKIRQDFGKKFREAREANAEGNLQDSVDKLAAAYNPELKQLLTAEQYNRLRQIQWQLEGNRVYRDPEVIAALELTEDQQKQIGEATRAAFGERVKLLNQEELIAEVRRQSRAVSEDWQKEIEQILSKEQWEKFEKLENRDKLSLRSSSS